MGVLRSFIILVLTWTWGISPSSSQITRISNAMFTLPMGSLSTIDLSFEKTASSSPVAETIVSCIDSSSYQVVLITGDHDIETSLDLTLEKTDQSNYLISDIPINDSIIITITDLNLGCSTILNIVPPDCSCNHKPLTNIYHEGQLITNPSTTPKLTCYENSLELYTEAEANIIYSWQQSSTNQRETGQKFTVSKAGEISFTALDTLTGCSEEVQLLIRADTLHPAIVFDDIDTLNCDVKVVVIDARQSQLFFIGTDYELVWYDSTFTQIIDDRINLDVYFPGQYYFEVTNLINGCSDLDSISISANFERPDIALPTHQHLSCTDAFISLTPELLRPGNYSYTWVYDENTISTELNTAVSEVGEYKLKVTDLSSGCATLDTMMVLPSIEIESALITTAHPSCAGESTGVITVQEVVGGTPEYKYLLNDELTSTSNLENLTSGNYNFKIRDSLGCTFDTLITLSEPTAISFEAKENNIEVALGADALIKLNTNLDFENIDTIIWNPDIACTNCLESTLENITEDQNYLVTIIDTNGCQEIIELIVSLEDSLRVYMPNVISSLVQGNNIFYPQSRNENLMIEELVIYDRWGNVVFKNEEFLMNDPISGWDGTLSGTKVETGVYIYMMSIRDGSSIEIMQGNFTLIR